jgi:hypothetical protein
MKKNDLQRPATKGDLGELCGQMIGAVGKALEDYPTKDDVQHLEDKIDDLSADVSGLRNRVVNLEMKHGSSHSYTA